ncbi:MAG: hypothetical protein C3F02_00420 [Parcubacteria group bacterium]|nr:MAG: hypothetical protein C3F02_00420 [Parcubacteria group bacterium]
MKKLKVLITAGSTYIPIDSVRVITNIFKGRLGIEIAKEFVESGAEVKLLLGNSDIEIEESFKKGLNIVRYKYYDDLYSLVLREIKNDYDVVIHSSAVSDYKLADYKEGKIKSGQPELVLHLVPTEKIVDLFKKADASIFLIMFKLEVDKNREELLEVAKKSKDRANADVIVANDFREMKNNHRVYIVYERGVKEVAGKTNIAKELIKIVYDKFGE